MVDYFTINMKKIIVDHHIENCKDDEYCFAYCDYLYNRLIHIFKCGVDLNDGMYIEVLILAFKQIQVINDSVYNYYVDLFLFSLSEYAFPKPIKNIIINRL